MKKIKWPTPQEVQNWIYNLPIVKQVLDWSKKTSLPGFFRVPIYDVVIFVFNEIRRFDLFTRANSIAYSFFLSLFPSLLTLFTLVPFILDFFSGIVPELANFNHVLQQEINRVMPGQAGSLVFDFIHDITDTPRIGLLSFGFVLAIYFSSNGMLAMMKSFEKSYRDTFKQRGGIRKRAVAIMLTGLVSFLVIFSVIFIILGSIIITWISEAVHLTQIGAFAIGLLRWFSILMVFYFGIAVLYRYGSATHRRMAIFSPGTTLATVLCILSSLAFSFYIDEFNRYDSYHKFYGSIGTFIIIMLWIQLNSLILLIGFELNAAIAVNRDLKAQQDD
ncbi:YihY/virulence factor BrkB family protein [Lewinella sp. LCG006]|uniref:YihY/virulence factor BrkB family protein n=1 Tax=Lewinella sp. LCG006 TaxID=3231911 RepID=UPI003460871F